MSAPVRPPSRWRLATRYAWLALVIVVVALVLADRWDEVRPELAGARLGWLGLSSVLALGGVGCSSLVWRVLLGGLGARLPAAAGVRVFFVGQLGKYLPGSVWPVLAQAELGRDHQVPTRASVAAVMLFLWVHLLTGAAVAAGALALAGAVPPATVVLVVPALALLAPGLLGRALALALRLARRQPLAALPGRGALVRAVGAAAVMWVLYGMHLGTVVAALDHRAGLLLVTGTFAAAWCAGFVFVIAPAGAGVREVAMAGLLAVGLPAGAAIAVTLLSRLLVTAADVAWAAVGLGLGRR